MNQFSEDSIKANCPHCDTSSHAFEYLLETTEHFYILCDANALEEGHMLIIPKAHHASIAQYSPEEFDEFQSLYNKVSNFVREHYGPVAVFEHGKFGQTVFHSHVHFLPFNGMPTDIVPEGEDKLRPLHGLDDLKMVFEHDGGYLFFALEDKFWSVDPGLAAPRFFRDRFAKAVGAPERGNWKAMREDPDILAEVKIENDAVRAAWQKYSA